MSDVTPDALPKGKGLTGGKIAGIPTLYLVGGGLALGIGFYVYKKRSASSTPVSTINASGNVADTTSTPSGGNGGIGTVGGGSTVANPTPPSNAQWASGALNAAIGNGSVNPTDGANAVTAFLNGQTLTAAQAAIISKLTTAYGQPPEGVLPISTTPPPITADNTPTRYIRDSNGAISAQTASGYTYVLTEPEWNALAAQGATYQQLTNTDYNTTVQKAHQYVVQAGDTPQTISSRFYGSSLYATRIPSTLTPGTTITIPAN
jgi:hypothetical protein